MINDQNTRELETLFYALGISSGFNTTKYCRLFKQYSEQNITKEELYNSIKLPNDEIWRQAEDEIREAKSMGITPVSIISDDYPDKLFEIDDPPLMLFVSGKDEFQSKCLKKHLQFGVVGSRKITPYGISVTKKVSHALAELGFTVVSGLAYGVDKCAHQGALEVSNTCPTTAILGSGLLEVYPALHRNLASEIIRAGGLMVSEFGLRTTPRSYYFPRRNRIVSGLSLGVVIVEAAEKSGSLITARLAMEQGREVFAVPGPIDATCSKGCNKILSEGASPVLSIDDFIETIREKFPECEEQQEVKPQSLSSQVIEIRPKRKERFRQGLTEKETLLIEKIEQGYDTFDTLIELEIFQDSELRGLLLQLQMNDYIQEVGESYLITK